MCDWNWFMEALVTASIDLQYLPKAKQSYDITKSRMVWSR